MTVHAGPDAEPDAGPEPAGPAGAASAVELAAAFGRQLAQAGPGLWKRLRPRTVLYVHLTQDTLTTLSTPGVAPGVARVEGLGPTGLTQLRDWIGGDAVEIRPVLDPTDLTPVDRYEIPPAMAEALHLREPVETFPYGTQPSRPTDAGGADTDHTIPYLPPDRGGPPGQTGLHNLAPLSRHHHRAKTFGAFTCHQPLPGLYLWRTPTGHWYRVDPTGTHPLGRDLPEILRQRTTEPEPELRTEPAPEPDPLSTAEQRLRDLITPAA